MPNHSNFHFLSPGFTSLSSRCAQHNDRRSQHDENISRERSVLYVLIIARLESFSKLRKILLADTSLILFSMNEKNSFIINIIQKSQESISFLDFIFFYYDLKLIYNFSIYNSWFIILCCR
jgi:hypothetical protein